MTDVEPDPRYDWLIRNVVSHFKTTNLDNFNFSQAEEGSIYEFLDNENAMALWFTENRSGNGLNVTARAPTSIKTAKAGGTDSGKKDMGMGFFYVIKLKQGTIDGDIDVARDQVMIGDLPPGMNALEHLGRIAAEIYLPMVTNPKLKEVWSELVMKDVTEGAHGFMANVQITSGRVGGMTMLPLPPDEELNAEEEPDLDFEKSVLVGDVEELEQNKDRIHVLEGTIITWTKQIKAVLKEDPEMLLNNGLHPGALAEVGFWKSLSTNLNSIFEQLQTEKVRRVLRFLDRAKSTYTAPFGKLCKEMFMARSQANSNHRFLRSLRPWIENLEGELEFEKLARHFRPIMHTILLIWKGSPYYNSPARLVVVMRELCNTLITKATAYLSGDRVFELIENEQSREAIEMLRTMLRVFGTFKTTYFDYKSKAAIEVPENPWRVQNNAIFVRLDAFLERCHDVLDLTQTILQFGKLAKVEVGGTKGKVLTTSVMQIYADFLASVDKIQNVDYDIMDLEKKQFEERWYEFRGTIKELDQRLGSVMTQGFDDCTTVANHFKLLDSFDSLVRRPAIADDLERKYIELISLYLDDLHQVQHIFMAGRDSPPISNNLPPIAGALSWIRGLQERVQQPMDKLRLLDRKIMERGEAREAIAEYTTFLGHLDEFRKQHITAWGASVESSSQAKLRNPLLRKELDVSGSSGAELLYVNFDPGLTSLLREVKYFLLLGLAVPEMALEIFGKGEVFRRHMGNLELIVSMYNFIQTSLLPVERPLLRHQLEKIDRLLSQGIGSANGSKKSKGDPKCLSWKSNSIELFINEANTEVQEVYGVLAVMKENLSRVEELLDTWSVAPLFARYNKASSLKDFETLQRQTRSQRYQIIKNGGTEVHKLLKDTIRKLKVSQGLPDWKSYVDFINNIVVGGLVQIVIVSLEYLEQQVDPLNILKQNLSPIVEIELDLVGSKVAFQPDLDLVSTREPNKFGIRNTVQAWIDSFMSCAGVFKRIDSGEGNYLKEMQDDPYIQMLLASINNLMMDMVKKGAQFRKQFEKYAYLWETDLPIMFQDFIADATIILDDDEDNGAAKSAIDDDGDGPMQELGSPSAMGTEDGIDFPQPKKLGDDGTAVDLAKFDEKVKEFLEVQAEIADLKPVHDMDFLRINAQPIKQALGTCVTKWMFFFTQFLQDFVAKRLSDVFAFVAEVSSGLDAEVTPGDRESLMAVMGHIRNVRKRMKEMDRTFGPLREMVMLLKTHGIPMDLGTIGEVDALTYLENAPMEWDDTVNKTFRVKELIQPMQNTMVDTIKVEIAAFSRKVDAFVQGFRRDAPFNFPSREVRGGDSCTNVYKQLDGFQRDLVAMESESSDLEELEELFELAQTRHSRLADMRVELGRLKMVWDTICLANFLFASWKPTLWADINIDDLLDETSTLQKQIKRLPRFVRDWECYQALEQEVKNMAIVLPLVQDLRSPAMRERHWKALVSVTRKHFEKTPSFALEDLLALELHNYIDGVQEVVETATKELKVESKLKTIADAWVKLNFEFTRHRDSEVFVLVASDEVLETLEDHQMQLQSMASMGRFVEFFKSQVDKWQRTLGNVETVVKLLLGAQKCWSSLEAIFLASADIRSSLPDDTKRFEEVDAGFKELMVNAKARPQVVECCNTEGREETLLSMNKNLEMCQRALNEYLDMKKNVFPRFYFVSNMALLDILSNGNNAPKIMPHLGSVFDGVGNLELELTNDARTKLAELQAVAERDANAPPAIVLPDSATAMFAKDGEKIKFPSIFIIQGAVETWLTSLVSTMQDTLRASTNKSLEEAANWEIDKPREDWTLSYPAQVALLVSQMVWTEETEGALEEFENGAEDALKKYNEVCTSRLEALIRLVQGDLNRNDRNKVITLITIDVHNRDMVTMLVDKKVESSQDFAWQSQLKFYWDPDKKDVGIKICDFESVYSFEYVGNCGRLVITPLTDRCYVTLTTALRLFLGGAPAGPAGTGKTETTKDLARGLGVPCYVFNCSDQFNYQTMADIFKGLSQVGAWGCFDEFNRIPIEVLSVVATQVKLVQDAILKFSVPTQREDVYQHLPAGTPPVKVGNFDFFGQSIFLVPTCGFFITMNPGYAGRTELPENLKALFRSCAMIRPDLKPICENMLMAEGFVKARPLAIKFVTLYALSADLLSKQAHYDWGLRAVKSVLRVAGSLKRAEPRVDEEAILMRALRDFNTPKIPLVDLAIFLRLISDIFPGLDLPTKFNQQLKEVCVKVCANSNLQSDDIFVGKVIQYQELLDVRHSVMLLGPAGAGKSTVWKTLVACHNFEKPKPITVYEPVNPKAVTGDELYGTMTQSKDWKEGCLSIVMRNMSKEWAPYTATQTQKWVVLDGDIDAVWIESMNTVMDDNKVLTLVSNERIPLTPSMRMIFEIHSLKNATPATVSRAGILFLNEADVGWAPFVESWLQSRENDAEVAILSPLFDKHIPTALEVLKIANVETLVPMTTINMVSTVCYLLEGILQQNPAASKNHEYMERLFLFAAVWAFGGVASADKGSNSRLAFSKAWKEAFGKIVKYPEVPGSLVFDFYVLDIGAEDKLGCGMAPWTNRVPAYAPVGDVSFANIVVPTADLVRLTAVADLLVRAGRPVLMVGGAGTGKTTLVREYLKSVDEVMNSSTINMNYYTDAATLQAQLEMPIDKRSGKTYGPPGGKRLVYFIDDLNMPFVEQYGTQTPIELIRQHMDYQSWFDRSDLGLKRNIVDVQYISAMNHKSGSFFVNPRLQRHYATMACQLASDDDLKMVYESILSHHLANFTNPVQIAATSIVDATIMLHKEMCARFLPSAVKFHYNFTMRDLSSIFQGLCLSQTSYYRTSLSICRLWFHECLRVFGDRLISAPEIARCTELLMDTSKRFLGDHAEPDELFAQPLVFTNFATPTMDDNGTYLAVSDNAQLKKVLDEKLAEYNDQNAIMNLVLFDEAMMHVARIARIIGMPRGNALLIGVGGSGKQSLSRLASFICGMSVQQISMTSTYGINDLKEELKELYRKAGVKPADPLVFMMTDSQVVDERFLVYINDLLSSGVIPDLFSKDEYDAILSSLRNAAKAAGVADARDQMMDFFIDRVRSNLHIVLCMSPVGDALRVRARKFPGLINCTAIDWFHEWPKDALVQVAHFFLGDIENITSEMKENVSHHMSEVHLSVGRVSVKFLEREKRHNHTTPKSFLELISFYKALLNEKRGEMTAMINRYDTGLTTLRNTNKDVEALQEDLKVKMVEVEKKKQATNELLEEMGAQRSEAEAAQAVADQEKEKADQAAKVARTIEQQAEGDLAKARPALEAAEQAVNGLDKASMTELKGFNTLPAGVDKVAMALLILVKDEKKNFSWDNAKKMMAKVDAFKQTLEQFDGENIDSDKLHRVQPILDDPIFTYEKMKGKSGAAANLCNWVVNICEYNKVYKKVKPLMEQLSAARAAKHKAEKELEVVLASLRKLDKALAELQTKFLAATEEKARVEAEAQICSDRLSLAERLTMGLAAENERWGLEIDHLRVQEGTVLGDVLLSAAFVSYAGAFSAPFRIQLWQNIWMSDLQSREIPITEGVDPIKMLASDALVAEWMNEGLPADRISMENGAIITNGARWPLIIDPQLQGIKWVRAHEEARAAAPTNAGGGFDVIVTQVGMKGWMGTITNAIQNGNVVILENLGQQIDAVLDPVLSRAVFRKGRNLFLRLGGEDIEYDQSFKLYLQTKLANPHYKPEIAAQCSIINFIVTERGLEDQLLAKVVAAEQPKLENDRLELVKAFNQYKIQLKGLEDELLERLANAPEDILSDVPLIEGLEATKEKATEINAAVVKGKQTEIGINKAREVYRPIAHEASLLYFMLLKLCLIDHMYQYSLDSFNYFFAKGMEKAKAHDEVAKRVHFLQSSVRWTVFLWTCRGLFEEHKLIFLTQMTFGFLQSGALGDESGYTPEAMNFLLRTPRRADGESPVEWVTDGQWGMVAALSEQIDGFGKFQRDLEDSAPRFLEWFNHNTPETEKLPLDWRQLDNTPFKKLLVIRCLRPDRLTMAISKFVTATLPSGSEYTECDSQLNSYTVLEQSFADSSEAIPIYFILSKGSNVVADVDKLAAKFGMVAGVSYHNISLGQGQDIIAEERLENGHRQGHWVILNNVHLMPRWLKKVEKMLDDFKQEGSHQNFRVFLSSDPSNSIPIGILERCIKLTSDPPSGLKANLKQAFCTFSKDEIEEMEPRTKGILFGLCHFHAIMLERRKFGPKGFNMMYPFSIGDLVNSAAVLRNYMENAPTHVPWQDLRYLFGQIMYGGHIIDDFDRLMCSTYLEHFMKDAVLDEMDLFPFSDSKEGNGFLAPTTSKSYDNCLDHIDQNLVGDSPIAFGMHPNAEIAMRTDSSEKLMACILELSAGSGGGGGGDDEDDGGADSNSPQNAAEAALQDILEQFRDQRFDLEGITSLLDEVGPYQNVFLQECERLNALLAVMTQTLTELDLGFRGELTMSEAMEAVQTSLFLDRVPAAWFKTAFPSMRSLSLWTVNLQQRLTQMADWAVAPSEIPISTWISGLFNPQSFLTAIMQITAQAQALELDKLVIFTEVTKKLDGADVAAPSRDGAFIHGLSLEGARWNANNSLLETSQPREMYSPLPVINCRPTMSDKVESGTYGCPVYMTQMRGPTFVFKAALRTKAPPAKWILAGVAAIMDIV